MRKVIIFFICLFLVSSAISQWNPYVSAGSSLSSSAFSYSAELGIYKDKIWYSLGTTAWENNNKIEWAVFAKGYRRIAKFDNVSTFVTGSVAVNINPERTLSVSPGLATVFNLGKRFAPQISLDFPIYENSVPYKTLPLVFGVSLNYWIK